MSAIADQAAIALKNAYLHSRTDEALAWRLQQLASILEATHDGILFLNLGGHVISANPALATLLGVPLDELLRAGVHTPLGLEKRSTIQRLGYDEGEFQAETQELIYGVNEFRRKMIHVYGPPVRYVERTVQPVRSVDETVDGWLFVLRDLSEEVKLEQMREDLVQMIVHDLRAPLTIIQSGNEVVRSSIGIGRIDNATHMLDVIGKSTRRMINLINQMLNIRQFESADLELDLQPISIRSLIQEVLEQFSPAIQEAEIKINLNLPDSLPELEGDPEHVERIFFNLLDNSIKFTPSCGQIDVSARFDTTPDKPRLIVSIMDNGAGISAEMLPQVFNKLKTASLQTARRKGSGLGLYYCKLAVEAHHGCVWAESDEGQGSTFYVALPVALHA